MLRIWQKLILKKVTSNILEIWNTLWNQPRIECKCDFITNFASLFIFKIGQQVFFFRAPNFVEGHLTDSFYEDTRSQLLLIWDVCGWSSNFDEYFCNLSRLVFTIGYACKPFNSGKRPFLAQKNLLYKKISRSYKISADVERSRKVFRYDVAIVKYKKYCI